MSEVLAALCGMFTGWYVLGINKVYLKRKRLLYHVAFIIRCLGGED